MVNGYNRYNEVSEPAAYSGGMLGGPVPKNGTGINSACGELCNAVESMGKHIAELEQVLEGGGMLRAASPRATDAGQQAQPSMRSRVNEEIAEQACRVRILCDRLSEIKARIDA